jgi:hypothetical protein
VFAQTAVLFDAKLEYLKELKRMLKDPLVAARYLLGPQHRSGRPCFLTTLQQNFIIQLLNDERKLILRSLRSQFITAYYQDPTHGPSYSTIYSTVRNAGLTHKQISRRHIYRSEAEGL